MPEESFPRAKPEFAFRSAGGFLRENGIAAALLSALVLAPCFWHSRIQAGDLGSHVYNAWLAQLIERGQLPGLVLVHQWNNVLFDVLLLRTANLFGFSAAEKVAVSSTVLIFFWGCFAFLAELSGKTPWLLAPFLALLSYGYALHMGFMNYYLSCGLAFIAVALVCRGGAGNWLLALGVAALCLFAHPIGLALCVGVSAYVLIQRHLTGWPRIVLPAASLLSACLLKHYFEMHPELEANWRSEGALQLLGQDQLNLFGNRYVVLSWFLLAWSLVCLVAAVYDWVLRARRGSRWIAVAGELYAISVIATFFLPENFRVSLYAGWIGLLVSRLTLVTAIFGLLVLASLPLPRWTVRGSLVLALVFFVFLYQDTDKLDRLEGTAREATATLPAGTRVVAVANPPEDWRIPFLYHSIERACIERCFSYANYEPSSRQFRVRALPGNFYVTASVDQADDMASGDYIVRPKDLPLTSLYQCDLNDFTQICAMALRAGQKTEDPEADPGPIPAAAEDHQ